MSRLQKPKLIFVYPNQFGYHTDSYKYCEHLPYSFDIIYICFDQGFEKMLLPDVEVIYVPYNTGKIRRLVTFYYQVFQSARNTRTDILFIIQFKFCFLIGLFARSKIKILDYRTGDLRPNSFMRNLNNMLIRFDALFFRNISVISEGLRNILHLNKVKTHILPLGADVISALPHYSDRMDLLYVGSLNSRNIHETIEGVALFVSKNEQYSSLVSYTIIGFGNTQDEEQITNSIEKSGLTETVRFLGRKKYTDLLPYFDTCNIGVSYVPMTPYYEYQPVTKLFEYMLSGMPVIATNTYENKLIVDINNGVLINDTPEEFCNGLITIYNRRNLYNSFDIRKSVETYTWGNIINNNLKLYLERLLE